jgi:hypothetical protein
MPEKTSVSCAKTFLLVKKHKIRRWTVIYTLADLYDTSFDAYEIIIPAKFVQ